MTWFILYFVVIGHHWTLIVPIGNENWNKQCLLDTSRTVMVNKENYYRDYKGHTKWLSLISSHFAKNFFLAWRFFMHMLIISVLYVQSIRELQ